MRAHHVPLRLQHEHLVAVVALVDEEASCDVALLRRDADAAEPLYIASVVRLVEIEIARVVWRRSVARAFLLLGCDVITVAFDCTAVRRAVLLAVVSCVLVALLCVLLSAILALLSSIIFAFLSDIILAQFDSILRVLCSAILAEAHCSITAVLSCVIFTQLDRVIFDENGSIILTLLRQVDDAGDRSG